MSFSVVVHWWYFVILFVVLSIVVPNIIAQKNNNNTYDMVSPLLMIGSFVLFITVAAIIVICRFAFGGM